MQRKISSIFFAIMLGLSTPALSLDLKTAGVSFTSETSAFSPNIATLSDIVSEQPNEAFLDVSDVISYDNVFSDAFNPDDYYEFENTDDDSSTTKTETTPVTTYAQKPEKKSVPPKVSEKKVSTSQKPSKDNITKPKVISSKPIDKFANIHVAEGEEVLVSSSIPSITKTDYIKPIATPKTIATIPPQQNIVPSNPIVVATKTPTPITNIPTPIPEPVIAKNDSPIQNVTNITPYNITPQDDNPFGVMISKSTPKKSRSGKITNSAKVKKQKNAISTGKSNPFVRAFSALRPEKMTSSKIRKATYDMTRSAPKRREQNISSISSEALKRDLNRTYLSDNQYLSPVESIDDEDDFDEDEDEDIEDEMEESVDDEEEEEAEERTEEMADDINYSYQQNVGQALEGVGPANINAISNKSTSTKPAFSSNEIKSKINDAKSSKLLPPGPLKVGSREVLQMKIDFQDGSSAVSGESVNLIRSFAQVATDQPTNSIEITIPESVMNNPKKKKLTARRLSIVSRILRDTGISDKQIKPVLTDRDENSFAFRIVPNDEFNRLRISKGSDMFGEDENVKVYNVMKW